MVALLIGLVAGSIAWRQYRVARAKLNLDLFEHRFALYDVIWTYLSAAEQGDGASDADLNNAIPKAHFLFGPEIANFMHACIENKQRQRAAARELSQTPSDGPLRTRAERALTELMDFWVRERVGLRTRFAPYMDFKEWR